MTRVTRLRQYNVEVVYATTPKQWRKAWRHFGVTECEPPPEAAGQTSSLRHEAGGDLGGIVIWLDREHRLHSNPAAVVDTLAHEAFHAVTFLLDAINEPRDKWHEQPAYLLGWLVGWLWTNTPKGLRQ